MLFNMSYRTGKIPQEWKNANVVPIHKKKDKSNVENYRPISLLPICGKMFEKITFNNLYPYLNANNLITKKSKEFALGNDNISLPPF